MDSFKLIDQESRDRFCSQIDKNFSVIAPAGVGKTRAIVERIINIAFAEENDSSPGLENLVVVTYTRKAAAEMQSRARQELLKRNAPAKIFTQFNKAFFGTIHSFCLDLLQKHGHQIGLVHQFELLEIDAESWLDFLHHSDSLTSFLPENVRAFFMRHFDVSLLLKMAGSFLPEGAFPEVPLVLPHLNLDDLLNFKASARNEAKVAEGQRILKNWKSQYDLRVSPLPLPSYKNGGKEFQELWNETFLRTKEFLSKVAIVILRHIADSYQKHRLDKGFVKYQDMVELASGLLKKSEVVQKIYSQSMSIILDEAQDTDATQFEILLTVAGYQIDKFSSTNTGRFCMVGDPQQSIFSDRADLPTYLRIHNQMIDCFAVEGLSFDVTMRCDRKIVEAVNQFFPSILSPGERAGQVPFSPLEPRPWAGEGFVSRLQMNPPEGFNEKHAVEVEANLLADFLVREGVAGLGVSQWHEVAILAPRNKWLLVIADSLQAAGLNFQVHSRSDICGEDPAYAWVTALMAIALEPLDGFEIAGILREVFSVSDHDIACYIRQGNELQILSPSEDRDGVAGLLLMLHQAREASKGYSLRNYIEFWISETCLEERLNALPDSISSDISDALNGILLDAARAEEKGLGLSEWVAKLKKQFYQKRGEVSPAVDHIQLYSCHKSKGLEWPLVIMPYFFRGVKFPVGLYPKMIKRDGGRTLVIDNTQYTDDDKINAENKQCGELERLLYVAMTRAKRSLIIVDDEKLFSLKKNRNSFADLLRCFPEETNRVSWEALPYGLNGQPCGTSSPEEALDAVTIKLEAFSKQVIAQGKLESNKYLRRRVPSRLTYHDSLRSEEGSEISSDHDLAIAYGDWWHASLEKAPWSEPFSAWNSFLDSVMPQCPVPDRGAAELRKLMQSEIKDLLDQEDWVVMTEVPFLWKQDSHNCFEGIIDWLAFSSHGSSWVLIDWKTDRVGDQDISNLLDQYKPQLDLYGKALNNIYNLPGQKYIYSTQRGKLLTVSS